MGQRSGFSPSDVQKINAMYKCGSSGGGASYPANSRPLLVGGSGFSNGPTTVNPVLGFFANLFGLKGDEQVSTDGAVNATTPNPDASVE